MLCTEEGCLKDRRTYFLVSNLAWQYVTSNQVNARCKLPHGKEYISSGWLVSSFLKQLAALIEPVCAEEISISKESSRFQGDVFICHSSLRAFCFPVFGVARASAQCVNEYGSWGGCCN